jgi:hypothetical protein
LDEAARKAEAAREAREAREAEKAAANGGNKPTKIREGWRSRLRKSRTNWHRSGANQSREGGVGSEERFRRVVGSLGSGVENGQDRGETQEEMEAR